MDTRYLLDSVVGNEYIAQLLVFGRPGLDR